MSNSLEAFRLRDVFKKLLQEKVSAIALIILIAYLMTAIVGECYSYMSSDPVYKRSNIDNRYQPPSSEHWLGTDYNGRDVFWRAVHGTRTAVKIGIIASFLSATIGVTLGCLAGYFGGKTDDIVVWIYSTFASMPTLLFILAFALLVTKGFLFPPLAKFLKYMNDEFKVDTGMVAIYLGVGMTGWVSLCRVVRAETLKLKESAYVQAACSLGFHPFRIIIKHVLPNLFHIVIIYFTMRFAYAIMTEVIVSYLGLGVISEPSWGTMISHGQERLWRGIWWEVAGATGFMFFLVLSLHLLGDYLRDILDPKSG